MRKVSRSRAVIGRCAGTVSSSGPSMRFKTLRSASSGRSRSTGSSNASAPSSTSIIVARARIGLVIDVMRKIVSRRIGSLLPNAITPIASTLTSSPCATRVTMPGSSLFATRAAMASCKRSRPARDWESIILMNSMLWCTRLMTQFCFGARLGAWDVRGPSLLPRGDSPDSRHRRFPLRRQRAEMQGDSFLSGGGS